MASPALDSEAVAALAAPGCNSSSLEGNADSGGGFTGADSGPIADTGPWWPTRDSP